MMEDLLNCKDLYDPIEGDNAKPSDIVDADRKKLKKQTLGVIRQWVDISLYNHVAKEINSHSWEEFGEDFLIWKLMSLKLKEERPIAEHLNDFEGTIAQL